MFSAFFLPTAAGEAHGSPPFFRQALSIAAAVSDRPPNAANALLTYTYNIFRKKRRRRGATLVELYGFLGLGNWFPAKRLSTPMWSDSLYPAVGRDCYRSVERQQMSGWGKAPLNKLSQHLFRSDRHTCFSNSPRP